MRLLSVADTGNAVFRVKACPVRRLLAVIAANDGHIIHYAWDDRFHLSLLDTRTWDRPLRIMWPRTPEEAYANFLIRAKEGFVGNQSIALAVSVSFDASGRQMVTIGPAGRIEVHRFADSASVLLGEPGQFGSACFDWTGDRLIATGWYVDDRPGGLLRAGLFDLESQRMVGECEGVGAVCLHPGGRVLASWIVQQGGEEIRFHRLTDRLENFAFWIEDYLQVTGMAFSPRGRELALVAEDEAWFDFTVLDFPSCRHRFSRSYEMRQQHQAPYRLCRECVFSADGRSVFFPFPNGYIAQLDSETGQEMARWKAHEGPVTTISIRHDLHILFSGGVDGRVKLWQLPPTDLPDPAEARAAAAAFEATHRVMPDGEPLWKMKRIAVDRPQLAPLPME